MCGISVTTSKGFRIISREQFFENFGMSNIFKLSRAGRKFCKFRSITSSINHINDMGGESEELNCIILYRSCRGFVLFFQKEKSTEKEIVEENN